MLRHATCQQGAAPAGAAADRPAAVVWRRRPPGAPTRVISGRQGAQARATMYCKNWSPAAAASCRARTTTSWRPHHHVLCCRGHPAYPAGKRPPPSTCGPCASARCCTATCLWAQLAVFVGAAPDRGSGSPEKGRAWRVRRRPWQHNTRTTVTAMDAGFLCSAAGIGRHGIICAADAVGATGWQRDDARTHKPRR
jgi:hypothetical protein